VCSSDLKGSEKSLKFFFRAFYGDEIEIDYPRDYMFATSDARWYVERTVACLLNIGDPETLEHTTVEVDRIPVSRASPATYVGQDGLLKTAGIDEARWDWTTGTPVLLAEPARTNFLPYSQDLTNAAWSAQLNAIAGRQANAAVAPDGTVTADKITFSGGVDPYIGQNVNTGAPLAGRTITWSIWAWTDPGQPVTTYEVYLYDFTVTYIYSTTISITTTPTRYQITATFPAGATTPIVIARFDGPQGAGPPPAGSYYYAWGGQVEEGTRTSYIATTAAAVTRAADIVGTPVTNLATVSKIIKVNGTGGSNVYDLVLENDQNLNYNLLAGAVTTGAAIRGYNINFDTGISSLVTLTSISSIISAPGVYLNTRSHLSNDQLFQDSLYYQQFSYVIRSRTDRETWADHVLKYLHPTGTVLFNDFNTDTIGINNASSSFVQVTRAETVVKIPTIKSYLSSPTFTFDRTADFQTGTSATTSAGAITYDAGFDYPGENITWALQGINDSALYGVPVTEIIRATGATFDKTQRTASVGLDQTFTGWSRDTNSSLVTTRLVLGSSNLTANTLLTSFTTTALSRNVSSMVLVMTWMKNSAGNAVSESSNAVVISFSSNSTIVPRFDAELQRNFTEVSLGRSLEYQNLIYISSSNSISANITSGQPVTSNITNSRIVFRPANYNRGLTYDRLTIKFDIDQALQLNTSLTETFNTVNITASGLIASWSGFTTSVSAGSFNPASSTGVYAFTSNCFIFNNTVGQSRALQTTSFLASEQVTVALRYCVGDNYNGGELPDSTENLEVQYSVNGGGSWLTGATIWAGGNTWFPGSVQKFGQVYVSSGSTQVQGSDTLFLTDYVVGDRITIGSGTTTAYTITSITNNNLMTIAPTAVTVRSGTILEGSAFAYVAGSGSSTNNSNFDGTWNFTMDSSAVSVLRASGLRALNGNTVNIEARLRVNSNSNPGTFQVDYGDGSSVNLTLPEGQFITTSFTVTGGPDGHLDFPGDAPNGFNFDLDYVRINGQTVFYKPPVSQQFQTTSVTVYGPGVASVSALVRVIQTQFSATNQDTYAIDSLTVTGFRTQPTTGTVSIGVAVSSNSTLNISDTDFFNITTIGA
jgi:hypothetical protein